MSQLFLKQAGRFIPIMCCAINLAACSAGDTNPSSEQSSTLTAVHDDHYSLGTRLTPEGYSFEICPAELDEAAVTLRTSGCVPALVDAAKQPVYFSQNELTSMFTADEMASIQNLIKTQEAQAKPQQKISVNTEGAGENFVQYMRDGLALYLFGCVDHVCQSHQSIFGWLGITTVVVGVFNLKRGVDLALATLGGVIIVPFTIATARTSMEMIEHTEVYHDPDTTSTNQPKIGGQTLSELQALSAVWGDLSSDHTSHQTVDSTVTLLRSMHAFFADVLPNKGLSGYCHPAAAGAPASCILSHQGQISTVTY